MTDAYERAKADDAQWEREHDTREKIERDALVIADNWRTYGGKSTFEAHDIIALLDRQAAITERHWMEINGANTLANIEINRQREELQRKVDELNAQNTRLNAKWAEANARAEKLQAKLDNAKGPDCGCCKWKEKVDELQAQLAQCMESYADAKDSRDRLQAELDEYDETHMLLPVDADGVPIRVGDKLVFTDHSGREFNVEVSPLTSREPSMYRYVKPKRTIEDVLWDFKIGNLTRKDAAEELRGMMGVCDE